MEPGSSCLLERVHAVPRSVSCIHRTSWKRCWPAWALRTREARLGEPSR